MSDLAQPLLTVAPPRMSPELLGQHLVKHWGLRGVLSPLTSERDLNHRLDSATGRFVVKLSNGAEPAAMTDFQTRAFLHVARTDPELPVQRIVPTFTGAISVALPEGALRVLSWLDGVPLHAAQRSFRQRRALGLGLARLTAALANFDHPAADHVLLWDIRQAPKLGSLLPAIPDAGLRDEVAGFVADYVARLAPEVDDLPRQVCHADFNPHNLLVAGDDPDHLTGILDFGDLVRTARICDLATAASYQIDPAAPLDSVSAFLAGYRGRLPLAPVEVALLFDLIIARLMTTLAITSWRAARYPDNAAYILRNAPLAKAGLAAFRGLGRDRATTAFARACGMETPR